MKYTEEDDVVRDAIEEAVRDREERDGGVETEVGEERGQGTHHTAN